MPKKSGILRSPAPQFVVPLLFLASGLALLGSGTVRRTAVQLADRVYSFLYQLYPQAATPAAAGYALLAIGGMVFLRMTLRRWVAASTHWDNIMCPRCGKEMHRIHRVKIQKLLLGLLGMPLWRYRCSSAECGWQGLRRRRISMGNVAVFRKTP